MRSFLSNFLLSIFLVVFAVPTTLLASPGNNWTPPVGGATGNNVPAPVNVGSSPQTKVGPLTVNGTLTSSLTSSFKGATFLEPGSDANNNFFVSFINSNFLGSQFNVGSDGTVGTVVRVNGRIFFSPRSSNGTQGSNQQAPRPGYYLRAVDESGEIKWDQGIPDGANDGDVLVWNSTTNSWESVVNNFGGGEGSLPPGTAGQTMWYNGTTNAWEQTDQIKHTTQGAYSKTILNNDMTEITGLSAVEIGSDAGTGATIIRSPYAKIFGTQELSLGRDVGGETRLESPSVVFGSPANSGSQITTFKSGSTRFKGPDSDPSIVDAGVGRLAHSVDANGSFKWIKALTYGIFELVPGITVGQLSLSNPRDNNDNQIGISVFSNEGLTYLADDATVGPDANLFLEGLRNPSILETNSGAVKHLCFVESDRNRVVKCPTGLPGDVNGGVGPVASAGDGTYRSHVNEEYLITQNANITVKYCGAGGGGGGGGIGSITPGNNIGSGGAGGGGGDAGECLTEQVAVQTGDRLSWTVGSGGAGGYGARYQAGSSAANNLANNGNRGGSTDVYLIRGGTTSSIGSSAEGGFGGNRGQSASEAPFNQPPSGGYSGNFGFASGPLGWFWNGQTGFISGQSCAGSGNGGCGGIGGPGVSYDDAGNLRVTPGWNGATGPSARGGGGLGVQNSDPETNRLGRDGQMAVIGSANGGGGGGGGFGQGIVTSFPANSILFAGGNGGNGGGGYVLLSGLPGYGGPDEIVLSNPGTQTLTFNDLSIIPIDEPSITVELWGAGGGAGGVEQVSGSSSVRRRSGAGGSGAYRSITISRQDLANSTFVVGSRGNNGNNPSMGFSGGASDGGNGGQTRIIAPTGTTTVNGGSGGQKTVNGVTGNGGAGATASSGTAGTAGVNGEIQGAPCNVSLEVTTPNNGFGAGSPRSCDDASTNVQEGSAQNGRIRISW